MACVLVFLWKFCFLALTDTNEFVQILELIEQVHFKLMFESLRSSVGAILIIS